jgi:hypothetical protein
MPHLVVALSPHGYGHASMTAPVVARLREMIPDLRLTLHTSISREWLATRYAEPFAVTGEIADFGLVMHSASEIDLIVSAGAYRRQLVDWNKLVELEAGRLSVLSPDLLLANVPHLTLAGAALAKIPAVALSCLNWAEIYAAYFQNEPEAEEIIGRIRAAYNSARCFIRPAPALPMPGLRDVRDVGPLARLGPKQSHELRRNLGLVDGERVGLVALGGIATRLPIEDWPVHSGWRWLTPPEWRVSRADCRDWTASGMSFAAILRSVDVVVTKVGYGTFTEAVCNGQPLLFADRPDWPETPFLSAWLFAQGRGAVIGPEKLANGDFAFELKELMNLPSKIPPIPSGINEAADIIAEMIRN